MPSFTQRAIKESFIKLLNQRPLKQITVKDIVEDCGINRNTFYYHFEDIPTLLKEIVTEQAELIIEKYPSIDSIETCLEAALQFALENKKAVLHIYHSVNRDIYEYYLMNVCDYVVRTYINTLFTIHQMSESDRGLIVRLYKCECFGIIIEWMNNDMKDDILDDFHRLCELRKGFAEELIERCQKRQI